MSVYLSNAGAYHWPGFLNALLLFGKDVQFHTASPVEADTNMQCACMQSVTWPMWMRIASRIASKLSCAEEESEERFLLRETRTTKR